MKYVSQIKKGYKKGSHYVRFAGNIGKTELYAINIQKILLFTVKIIGSIISATICHRRHS